MSEILGYPEPVVTHLGMVRGEWPVFAFSDEGQAAAWAAESPAERRTVWEVMILKLGEPMTARSVPATSVLEPIVSAKASE
jgi:hypothetical protein